MDKYLLILLVLIFLSSVVVIFNRRQGIKYIEKSRTNPTADDFEILE
jgi:hypothetical protein